MYMYENRCIPTIKPISLELDGNDLYIELPNLTLLNGKKWNLILCRCIPKGKSIGDVVFIVGTEKLKAINGIGNDLKTDMLRSRRRYTLTYGWDEPHIMVCGTVESAYIPKSAIFKNEK